MKFLPTLLLVSAFGLLLTGCASKTWYKPGVTPQQLQADIGDCKLRAMQYASQATQTTQPAVVVNQTVTVSPIGYVTPDAGNESYEFGHSLGAAFAAPAIRKQYFEACMESKGYQVVSP